jgi:AcrR family transcriptional regulator
MGRWQPDSQARLAESAYALYAEHGFDATTVAAIAERAGLTERTFFRHFEDKREVLFAGSTALQEQLVSAVAGAPERLAPLDAAILGLEAAGSLFRSRELSRQRQAIISSNPELQERELIKLASLSEALADTLRRRGVEEPAASLTAEVAIGVFRVAFERWIDDASDRDFPDLVRDSVAQLKVLTSAT